MRTISFYSSKLNQGTTELQGRREIGMGDCGGCKTVTLVSASSNGSSNLVGLQLAGIDAQAKRPQRQVYKMDFGTRTYLLRYSVVKGLRQPRSRQIKYECVRHKLMKWRQTAREGYSQYIIVRHA